MIDSFKIFFLFRMAIYGLQLILLSNMQQTFAESTTYCALAISPIKKKLSFTFQLIIAKYFYRIWSWNSWKTIPKNQLYS